MPRFDRGQAWLPSVARGNRPAFGGATLRLRRVILAAVLVVLGLSLPLPALAWSRKVKLTRTYRPGQQMVYQTKIHVRADISSEPASLKDLLPPLPTEFSIQQQNTVTIKAVRADGAADIETRVDRFEIQTNPSGQTPENLSDLAQEAQQDLNQRLPGHTLTAHYDRDGRLLGFEGSDELLQGLDAPVREPLRQALRLLLEQMGGNSLDPGHPVKPGEEWKHKLDSSPSADQPFKVDGEATLHYSGRTRYQGTKAAIVDFRFANVLTPALDRWPEAGPFGKLGAQGLQLDIRIAGQGQGRVLLAVDDGRMLQNHATLQQTLSARVKGLSALPQPTAQPPRLEIQSRTQLEVEGSGR